MALFALSIHVTGILPTYYLFYRWRRIANDEPAEYNPIVSSVDSDMFAGSSTSTNTSYSQTKPTQSFLANTQPDLTKIRTVIFKTLIRSNVANINPPENAVTLLAVCDTLTMHIQLFQLTLLDENFNLTQPNGIVGRRRGLFYPADLCLIANQI